MAASIVPVEIAFKAFVELLHTAYMTLPVNPDEKEEHDRMAARITLLVLNQMPLSSAPSPRNETVELNTNKVLRMTQGTRDICHTEG
jgi:hypothetical protein